MKTYTPIHTVEAELEAREPEFSCSGARWAEDTGTMILRYPDGSKLRMPKSQFDALYQEATGDLTFSQAMGLVRKGHKVARRGWTTDDPCVQLCTHWVPRFGRGARPEDPKPWIGILSNQTGSNAYYPTQADMLTDDWYITK